MDGHNSFEGRKLVPAAPQQKSSAQPATATIESLRLEIDAGYQLDEYQDAYTASHHLEHTAPDSTGAHPRREGLMQPCECGGCNSRLCCDACIRPKNTLE